MPESISSHILLNNRFLKELDLMKFTVFITVFKIGDKYSGITHEANACL